jgi:iron complex outermembrane receptor protein
MLANACIRHALLVFVYALLIAVSAFADSAKEIDIPAGELAFALQQLAHQSGVEFIYSTKDLEGVHTQGARGKLTAKEAVTKLLEGTQLQLTTHSSGAFLIAYPPAPTQPEPSGPTTPLSSSPQSPQASGSRRTHKDWTLSATSNSDEQLQEITVTATRREQSLSKVPISITALTQSTMDLLGSKDLIGIIRFTPGVSIVDQGNFVNVTIRGVGSSGGAATTGIYIDDTPIQERSLANSPGSQALPTTFDLDRVEVLRGPQGTLFGAGSEGGTIRYIMTQPSLTMFTSYARSEFSYTQGGAPSYEAGVAAGGPVIDDVLGIHASLWYRRDGGWIDSVNPTTHALIEKDNNYGESVAARIAATWAPTLRISIAPSLIYQDRQLHDLQTYWGILSSPQSYHFVTADPSRAPEDDYYGIGSLKITADLETLQLISNTSVFYRQDHNSYDGTLAYLSYYQTLGSPPDGTPFAGPLCPAHAACSPFVDASGIHLPAGLQGYREHGTFTSKQTAITQEIRLQSPELNELIAWTVGGYFSLERTTTLQQDNDPDVDRLFQGVFGGPECKVLRQRCNANGTTQLLNGDINFLGYETGRDRQVAGFAESAWTLTKRLKLIAGLRYSELGYESTSYAAGPINDGASYGTGQEHERALTKRLGLTLQASPADLYYATFSTGFRPGGANAPIPRDACAGDFASFGISGAPLEYKSDAVRSYELGAKHNLENSFRLSTSIFYVKWNEIQQSVLLPTCGNNYTANLGAAVSKGADLDFAWAVVDSVTLTMAAGYTSAVYTKNVLPGPNTNTPLVEKGDFVVSSQGAFSQPLSPWTISASTQYRFRALGHPTYARLDYEFASRNSTLFAGDDRRTVQYDQYLGPVSSHTFLSARLGTEINHFSLSFFVDNLLDSHTITSIAHTPLDRAGPQPPVSPLYTYTTFRPRTFGLTFIYRN